MNRIILIAVVAVSVLWLSGCVVISSEKHGPARAVRMVPAHPDRVVEVIDVPDSPSRPHREHGRPRG